MDALYFNNTTVSNRFLEELDNNFTDYNKLSITENLFNVDSNDVIYNDNNNPYSAILNKTDVINDAIDTLDPLSIDTDPAMFLNSTIEWTDLTYNITVFICPNISLNDFSVLSSVVYILLVLTGLFLCTTGFRYIRPSLFVMATALMSSTVYLICCEVFIYTPLPPLVIAGSSILSGLVVGLAALLLLNVGIRVACCKAGLVMGIYILATIRLFLNYPNPVYLRKSDTALFLNVNPPGINVIKNENVIEVITNNDDNNYSSLDVTDDDIISPSTTFDDIHHILPIAVTIIILLVCCILIIIASFLKPKFSLISSFCLGGSAMVTLGIDFFTDKRLTITHLFVDCLVVRLGKNRDVSEHMSLITCWTSWIVYGILPAVIFLSMLFQYLCSARGLDYSFKGLCACNGRINNRATTSSSPRRINDSTIGSNANKRTLERVPVLSMDPSEKYRHLYRVRRTNGDVISRTQMEAIEVRKSNPIMMMATRSNSDVTTTNDDADDVTLVLTRTGDD